MGVTPSRLIWCMKLDGNCHPGEAMALRPYVKMILGVFCKNV